MQDHETHPVPAPKRTPWNKGKLDRREGGLQNLPIDVLPRANRI